MTPFEWYVLAACMGCALLACGIVTGINYYHKKHPIGCVDDHIPMPYSEDDGWDHCDRG